MKQILPRNPFFDIDHKKIITDACLFIWFTFIGKETDTL